MTSVLQGGGYSIPTSQSGTAYTLINRTFGYRAMAFTAVFERTGTTSGRGLRSAADAFRVRVHERYSGRIQVSAPVLAPGGSVVLERIYIPARADFGIPLTQPLRALLPRTSGVKAYLTGTTAVLADMERVSDSDLRRAEIITFPIALLILLVIFGTVLGALMPVSMGPLTVAVALAIVYFLGRHVSMSIFVLNTSSMLGLGVAIDYSLFMVHRFREELRRDGDVERAVATTVATAGMAIVVSALTVATGFFGMTLVGVQMLTSLGIGGSLVVALSMVAALTFLPSVLGVLGPRINMFSVLPASVSTGGAWARLAHIVMRRAPLIIVGVSIVVIALAVPARHLRVGVPGPEILPLSAQSRAGNDILARHLGLANQSPVLLVLQSSRGFDRPAAQLGLLQLAGRVCRDPILAGVSQSPVVNSPHAIVPCGRALQAVESGAATAQRSVHVVLISLFLHADPSSQQAEGFVRFLRGLRPPAGIHLYVGGQTAGQLDFDNFIYARFPLAILFVIAVIFLILAVSFRSLVLPLKAILMNGLSILAAYGGTVWVFQEGHLRHLFGFTPTDFLDSIVPIFIFCALFGLSTDYEVFLLARVREEFLKTGDNTHSVALGLERTGRIITSAALVMLVVFSAFAFADLVVIKQLGFAMALGVLVDATLIRALLVPAAMRVFGRWNWWPGYRRGRTDVSVEHRLAS